jgi:uncharacterized membrane protein YebE (DUF533 family)
MTINKKLCAVTLSLVVLFAAAMPASAQSRYRDRSSFGGSMSTKKKVGIIAGGAAAGAVLGGLLGGKKGAVLGGLLGGGGGTGYVYYKGKQEEDRYGRYDGYRSNRNYRAYRSNDRYSRSYRRY